jgi:hypothetical protein
LLEYLLISCLSTKALQASAEDEFAEIGELLYHHKPENRSFEMLNLVKASILNFGQKVFLDTISLNLRGLTTRVMYFANICLECLGH